MLPFLALYVMASVGFGLMLLHDRDIRISVPVIVLFAACWPLLVVLMATGFVFQAVRR